MFKWLRQNTTSLAPIKEDVSKKKKNEDDFDYEAKPKEKLVMEDLIAESYVLLTKIGHGSFGDIILSYNLRDNIEVIVKREKKVKNQKSSPLHNESKVYQNILNVNFSQDMTGVKPLEQIEIQGISKFYGFGEKPDYYYLVMDFLGPNLSQLFKYCGKKKFTLGTICLIAMQLLNRIEYLHKRHIVHRDIKPENFCIGNEEKTNIIYMIDFGLAKKFLNPKTHQHIPYREGRPFVGTARYVSINTHLGIEQSRRDDLSSLGYVLIYLLKGSLPWQGLKGSNKESRLIEKKIQISNEILCSGLPNEFTHYMNYCKNLKYEERPDYDFLKGLFGKLLGLVISTFNLHRNEIIFDWCFDNVDTIWKKYYEKEDKSDKGSNKEESAKKDIEIDDKTDEENEENGHGLIDSLLEESSVGEMRKKSPRLHSKQTTKLHSDCKSNEESLISAGKQRNSLFKDDNNIINCIRYDENKSEEENSSCDTVREEFEGNKLLLNSDTNININLLKKGNNLNEDIDKKIFKIVGKSIEDYYFTPYIDDKERITEENEELEDSNKSIKKINPNLNTSTLEKKLQNSSILNSTIKNTINDTNVNPSLQKINNTLIDNPSTLYNIKGLNNQKKLTKEYSIDESLKNKVSIERFLTGNKNLNINSSENLNTINSITSPNINKRKSCFINSNQNLLTTVNNSTIQGEIKTSQNTLKPNQITNIEKQNLTQNKDSLTGPIKNKVTDKQFLEKVKLAKENILKIKKESLTKDYEICGEIGSGSYGTVKRVRHKKLKEYRAMKIILKKNETAQNEIDIMRKISHPRIVNTFDIYEDSKKYYIMMEACEGGELFEAISEQGAFTEEDCAHIIRQILEAVNYLHSKNIMHRDIKPENIMLTHKINKKNKKYEIKLIDFGTAKFFEKGKKETKFIGTSYYIAPEVLKESYDEKCDIWSAGVIMYILLSGYPPFNGNSNADIYHSIQNSQPYFHGEDWKEITPEAVDLLQKMLVKKPSKRLSAEQCLNHKWFKLLEEKNKDNNNTNNQFGKKLQMKVINKMNDFVKENRLKQAVLQFISNQFNLKKEEEDLQALFKEFDLKGAGEISKDIFYKKLIELYGEVEGKEICDKIFERLDLDGSGEISYNEFLSAMIDGKKILTEDRLEKAFRMFDKDGNGLLSIAEIIEVFGGDASYWTKIIEEVDSNNDGEVDFNEFKMLMGVFNGKDGIKK